MAAYSKSKKTKEKILQAALKLFSQKGFLGATTKEIAQEAGIAEVTLFRYFPSKQTLFQEVINTFSFLPKLKEIINLYKEEGYEVALKHIAFNFLKLLEENKDLIRIMHLEMQRYPEEIRKIHDSVVENTIKLLGNYFKELQKRGTLRTFDADLGARAFLGMLYSYFYVKEIKGVESVKKDEVWRVVEAYVDFFAHGTLKK